MLKVVQLLSNIRDNTAQQLGPVWDLIPTLLAYLCIGYHRSLYSDQNFNNAVEFEGLHYVASWCSTRRALPAPFAKERASEMAIHA